MKQEGELKILTEKDAIEKEDLKSRNIKWYKITALVMMGRRERGEPKPMVTVFYENETDVGRIS